MYVKRVEFIDNFYQLKYFSWSGALNTLDEIENNDKQEKLMSLLNEIFSEEEEIDATKLNDFLWFERDYIYEQLGIELE